MTTEPEKVKDGATLFTEIAQEPTLDLAMKKDPRDVSDEDLMAAVKAARMERALLIQKGE